MNPPHAITASHLADGNSPSSFLPFHERMTPRWQQLSAAARDAMRRSLGGRSLAPLPTKLQTQLPRHQPPRVVVQTESASEDMPSQPVALGEPATAVSQFPTPIGFVALLSAFRATGGTVRSDDLSRHVRSEEPGHLTNLARKLVSGAILSFSWRQTLWVPLFQFEGGGGTVRPSVARVMDELHGAFDSWEIALWFVQPNSWLKEQRPLDLIGKLDAEVLQAARVDRFVALG